jgi:hypothetical protein
MPETILSGEPHADAYNIRMTNISPDQRCKSCNGLLVPPVMASFECAPEAAYVCMS